MAVVKPELQKMWRDYELARGQVLTVQEVSQVTGLHWETVNNLREGKTQRFDAPVIAKLCEFFGVVPGEPVPFLIYDLEAA